MCIPLLRFGTSDTSIVLSLLSVWYLSDTTCPTSTCPNGFLTCYDWHLSFHKYLVTRFQVFRFSNFQEIKVSSIPKCSTVYHGGKVFKKHYTGGTEGDVRNQQPAGGILSLLHISCISFHGLYIIRTFM